MKQAATHSLNDWIWKKIKDKAKLHRLQSCHIPKKDETHLFRFKLFYKVHKVP